jgi:hypothetical protein
MWESETKAMRLLIYGMQSSGASTFVAVLAQRPNCGAFVDIWNCYAAPEIPGSEDIVAKVTVTASFPLSLHQERFRPDRTILFLRHPIVNYRSLMTKSYRHQSGFVEEKFAILNDIFVKQKGYDAVFHYEELLSDPLATLQKVSVLGWPCDPSYLDFKRTAGEIAAFNEERFPSVCERLQYGPGQHRGKMIRKELAALSELSAAEPVAAWCPDVLEHYNQLSGSR